MEFWGVEVQAGKPLKVTPEEDTLVHISHASLGDCKGKKGETVTLNVKVGDKRFVMGTLLSESIPQTVFDVMFDKEFELSHNWGKGSVYFVGYKCPNNKDDEGGEYFSDSEEEVEEEVPATVKANGNAAKAVAKPKPATAQAKKNVEPEADDSDSEGMDVDEDDSDDEDDSEEEEETPMKAESRKKRAHEAAPKTPVSAKKAKAEVTPKKTEEKKKGGPATPHPAKKGGKTPTTATQSPKSASQVSCGSCKKTFNSANALESHSKAKHSATAK